METLREFAVTREIAYPLLSDPGSQTIKAYGVLKEGGNGIPHPTIFIIDQAGVIRGKLRYEGYRKRHNSADIMAAVSKIR